LQSERPRNSWEGIYRREGTAYSSPLNHIRFASHHFKEAGVERVLDLGCGAGEHDYHLAQDGFSVHGLDFSRRALEVANQRFEGDELSASYLLASMYDPLPYRDSSFDGLVSLRALHHGRIEDIRRLISEIERILRPRGYIFVTVRKETRVKNRLPFKTIAPRTYVPLEGREKDVVHYLFDSKILRRELSNFKIHELWIDEHDYYCVLAELNS
jgi:ubiquinone/menaquinone biosynthesis C-methylase UbiE